MRLVDAAATARAGAWLASLVRGGDAIALVGDLGAGKTTLTAALVAALGGPAAASPTFSLVNRYDGLVTVWHVDLYRIDDERELPELGLDDAFDDRDAVVIVEWADKFAVMPPDHLRIELVHDGEARRLVARGTGVRGSELASELLGFTP